ncbi:hypothetical protein ACO0QE_002139 [Hanseniaspora vineae]
MPFVSYIDLENKTKEACQKFQQIDECTYSHEGLGLGRRFEEFMECDCSEDWRDGSNKACAENSDCINRLTQIECVNDRCSQCGEDCENQRFQKKQYSDISIIQTEKKGYGVIAQKNIPAQQFIIEYVGEVITENEFNQRMIEYDLDVEKRKHFYFMMLQKGEFIDATAKGCLARFCNHSCNPNAYVSKWVVNGKLRMGIFAERNIRQGEEITFDYNVDRYGAKAQKCYCGEPNCIGVLGGKVQTDTTNLLPDVFILALGSSRSAEKKFRQSFKSNKENKKLEIDEEGINKDFLKTLKMEPMKDKDEVSKVVAALLQTRSKALCMKLIQRVMLTKDETLKLEMVKLHGYSAISNVLDVLRSKERYVKIILKYLLTLPKTFRDTIVSSRIDKLVEDLGDTYELGEVLDLQIASSAKRLLEKWSTFEVYKRIQKKQNLEGASSNATAVSRRQERKRERLNDTKFYNNPNQPLLPHPGNIFNASPIPERKLASVNQLSQQTSLSKPKPVSHEATPRVTKFDSSALRPKAERSVENEVPEEVSLSKQSNFLNDTKISLPETKPISAQASFKQNSEAKAVASQIKEKQGSAQSSGIIHAEPLPPAQPETLEMPTLKNSTINSPVASIMEGALSSANGYLPRKLFVNQPPQKRYQYGATTGRFDLHSSSSLSNGPQASRFNSKPSRFSNSYSKFDAVPNQFNGRKRFIDQNDRLDREFTSKRPYKDSNWRYTGPSLQETKLNTSSQDSSQYVPSTNYQEQPHAFQPTKRFSRDNVSRDRPANISSQKQPHSNSNEMSIKPLLTGPRSEATRVISPNVALSASVNEPSVHVKTQNSFGALTPPYAVKTRSASWKDTGSRSSSNGGSSSRMSNKTPVEIAESKWKHFFSGFVPNVIFREFSTQSLPRSVCKKVIREFIHSLTDKEIQMNHFDPPIELTANYKKSIMDTAAIYVKKKNARIMKYAKDTDNGH